MYYFKRNNLTRYCWKKNQFIDIHKCCIDFLCVGLFVPLENFSLIRHHWRRRAANLDLCSALMAFEQWGFFSVPHLLWHGASVYNGHLRGLVTLTPITERLAVKLSLPVLTTDSWDSYTQSSACEANALTHRASAAVAALKKSVCQKEMIEIKWVLDHNQSVICLKLAGSSRWLHFVGSYLDETKCCQTLCFKVTTWVLIVWQNLLKKT